MAQGPKNPVTEAVDSCIVYWVAAGLPRAQIDQMAAELRAHLEQAVAAGKSVEAVIGGDVARFAEEWWRAVGRHQPRWQALVLAAQIVAAAVFITLLPAVWVHPVVAVEAAHLVQVLWMATGVWILFSPRLGARWLANSARERYGRLWVAVAAVTFVGMLVLSPAMPWVPEWVLLEIPRWQAVLVMVGCLVINGLAILRDPTRPRAPASLP
ncbi:hypothetical protein [Thermaerobacter composti]|uniref:Uncharacterized protein n=1 Tax=Thermaerobacter composti TaxID=554949 RepID=A0ABZ0QLR2_9FIRM|nr:hypothetical protein [Thermaerobacter composti]WPD18436.1 hypothetical protein Q5761_08670 [Thermaerobacter composti]